MVETLKDKIDGIKAKIAENDTSIADIKAQAEEDCKSLKEENKKLAQVARKLEATEAQIASIFSKPEPETNAE